MKKLFSFILAAALICAAMLSSCSSSYTDPTEGRKAVASTDKYRNYYEIFVGSFNDSDNDGTGDLRGIIDKLDYLNDGDPNSGDDLGIDGIWLTPIMPSPSYHKYDVEDYFNIDPTFGSLKDFDELIKKAHKRGINVIIDLVLNHSSNTHPLFQSAFDSALDGKLNSDADYYEIEKHDTDPGQGYTKIGNGYYYESNFSTHMPEWNLNSEKTRDYFKKIAEFWLKKHNVDGFRLDATRYYSNSHTDGVKFLKWFYGEAQKIKPDVYMVGENWSAKSEICDMYESGIDSFFAFPYSDSGGTVATAIKMNGAPKLSGSVESYESDTKAVNSKAINAYFFSNHDQKRSANYVKLKGRAGVKMAAALYMLFPGNSFIYYGEEIGQSQDATLNNDEYKREPMIWDDEKLPEITVNGIASADADHASYGGVKQQQSEPDSVLSFYKRVIRIKNQNPAIARGDYKALDLDNTELIANTVEYKGKKLAVIHNLSDSEEITVENELLSDSELVGDLVASNGEKADDDSVRSANVSLTGSKLILPPFSTAVVELK